MPSGKGQITFEYAIIIGLIAAALTMMQVYLRRGIQAGIKIAADEIGLQEDFENLDIKKGYLDNSTVEQATVDDVHTENPQVIPTVHTIEYQADGAQTTVLNEQLSVAGQSQYITKNEDDAAAEGAE